MSQGVSGQFIVCGKNVQMPSVKENASGKMSGGGGGGTARHTNVSGKIAIKYSLPEDNVS